MLDGIAPARRRLLYVALCLALVVVLVVGVAVWTQREPEVTPVDQATPGPIIVVPGYGGGPDSVAGLVDAARSVGRDAVAMDTPGDGTGDLRDQAVALGDLVEQTLERTGAESVDLVGYSAGGVVSRLYVRDEGGADVVRRVATLGSPHHGTTGAATVIEAVGSCNAACEQLTPDSDLLRRLNADDETPAGPEWVTLRSSSDEVVVPTDSAELEGALNVLVQDLCSGATTSHGGLTSDPVVLAALGTALDERAPRLPDDVPC